MENNAIGILLANAIQQQASRPQKSSQRTVTTGTEVPLELEDMRARRDTIGASRTALADSLAKREGFGYNLANALANIPGVQQAGTGQGLTNFAQAFGNAFNGRTNAEIARNQTDYEVSRTDLADALLYDKAMGSKSKQVQDQSLGYGEGGSGSGAGGIGVIPNDNFGRSTGYDPVADKLTFGPVARAAATGEQLGVGDWLTVPGTNSIAKGLQPTKSADLQTVYSDIADNIISGKVLDYIGKAGSVRVADTEDEKKMLFGPLTGYQTMSDTQLNNAISQARNNFVSSGMRKARAAGVPVTEEELKSHFNSAFTVPSGMKKRIEGAKNIQDSKPSSGFKKGQNIPVGTVQNGVRFDGYDEAGNPIFTKV